MDEARLDIVALVDALADLLGAPRWDEERHGELALYGAALVAQAQEVAHVGVVF